MFKSIIISIFIDANFTRNSVLLYYIMESCWKLASRLLCQALVWILISPIVRLFYFLFFTAFRNCMYILLRVGGLFTNYLFSVLVNRLLPLWPPAGKTDFTNEIPIHRLSITENIVIHDIMLTLMLINIICFICLFGFLLF